MKKALLFINGTPPKNLPGLEEYGLIACSDGAFHYLKSMNFPLEKLDFISGDFDSHSGSDEMLRQAQHDNFEVFHTPDQDKTDFHKSLEIIQKKGFKKVDVYGASGGEQDHFLGNLHVAFLFRNQLEIQFFDEFSTYFFSPKKLVLKNVQHKMVSLIPFSTVNNLKTKGLNWEINNENFSLTTKIGTRNFAVSKNVEISFAEGGLVVFLSHHYYL